MKYKLSDKTDKSENKYEVIEEKKIEIQSDFKSQIEEKPIYKLVVKSPFRKYSKGDVISGKAEVESILACHEKSMVVKVHNK